MKYAALVAGTLLTLASQAKANLLVNGSLETTLKMNKWGMLYASPTHNATALPGWTITAGTIDITPSSYWAVADGRFSVDLIGTPGVGSIRQTVATTAGQSYVLTFDFAINPDQRSAPRDEYNSTKKMDVSVLAADGTTPLIPDQMYSGTATATSRQSLTYATETFSFTATGAHSTLVFSALLPDNLPAAVTAKNVRSGPIIDNLDLELAGAATSPEPASLGLLGFGGMLLLGRRRRVAAGLGARL